MKPFLKWAGNKYQIVERIKEVLPPGQRLIEPFVGSGAVFMNTDYPGYVLADANADLISLYKHLREAGQNFIEYCRSFFTLEGNTPDIYYTHRARFNATNDSVEKAALFVYLNKHGYNGLCRYNSRGQFNVPFGRNLKPYFPETEMQFCYRRLQDVIVLIRDFANVMEDAAFGDVVYCDPTYVPLSATAHFTSYNAYGFGEKDQQKLVDMAEKLADRGIPVIISNHDTIYTRRIYEHAQKQIYFEVKRNISCDGANRNKVGEILAIFC
jgi:DNA adenine methylase